MKKYNASSLALLPPSICYYDTRCVNQSRIFLAKSEKSSLFSSLAEYWNYRIEKIGENICNAKAIRVKSWCKYTRVNSDVIFELHRTDSTPNQTYGFGNFLIQVTVTRIRDFYEPGLTECLRYTWKAESVYVIGRSTLLPLFAKFARKSRYVIIGLTNDVIARLTARGKIR